MKENEKLIPKEINKLVNLADKTYEKDNVGCKLVKVSSQNNRH